MSCCCVACVPGLQTLIEDANGYITRHGLRFNPSKTMSFQHKRWYLEGIHLEEDDPHTHIFKTVVRSVLVYGLESVYQTKAALHKAEVSQATLLIHHYCKLLIFRMCASQLKYKN